MKRIGPRTEPCGIPDFTLVEDEYASSTRTICDLSFKNDLIHTHVLPTKYTIDIIRNPFVYDVALQFDCKMINSLK